MVAPYWADADTTNGGNIYYRESTDAVILSTINADIAGTYSSQLPSFTATWAYIATWDRVAAYGGSSSVVSIKMNYTHICF